MKRTYLLFTVLTIFIFTAFFQSCKDDKEEVQEIPEFVADNKTFENFRSWSKITTRQGPDPAIGTAHEGNDETVSRTIYIKDNQDRAADGEFPIGTIVVKDTQKDGATIEVTAMVKRGSGFNPDNNDWEWFMLTPDGEIARGNDNLELRGAQLMGGMCGMCHSQVKDKDFIFVK